ncbi:hypothetical protein K440DRAFT_670464 [Wilcoxina mikolae CBS 423.85]|nr:hypothetical protein K440DRAFT_670464 [Wilcoxina mikolae CBS 423.85]
MNTALVSTRIMAPRLLPGAFLLNSPFSATVRLSLAVRHFQGNSKRLNDKVVGSGGVDNVDRAIYEELNEVKAKLEELITHSKSTDQDLSVVMKHTKSTDQDLSVVMKHTKSTDRVLSTVMKHTHIPLQLTILVRYSYKLLTGNSNTVPRQKRIFVPHTVSSLNTPEDTERAIQSLTARITSARAVYGSEPDRPHEITANMLSLRKRFKVLGLEGERDVVWLAGERNNIAHTTDGDAIVIMFEYLEDGRWKDFVKSVFPMVFGRDIADWENATKEEKSRKISNASNYELEQLEVMEDME